MAGDWFQICFPATAPIEVSVGGRDDRDVELISSYATPWGYLRPTKWLISIHPKMFTARVLFHELAHCLQPVYERADCRAPRMPGRGESCSPPAQRDEAPLAIQDALSEQFLAQPAILNDEER